MTDSFNIEGLTRSYSDFWWNAADIDALNERPFEKKEKRELEKKLSLFIKSLRPKKRFILFGRRGEINIDRTITEFFNSFSGSLFIHEREIIEKLPVNDFISVTKIFISKSREFDNTLSVDDIYQACRNVWIMNILQLMAGRKAEITPSVFAYSLLYPYCDNYIDDPKVSLPQKMEFGEKLKERLLGRYVVPSGLLEQKIYTLIGMIEEEFARGAYPQVYESLLAIHKAQIKSLAAQLSAKRISKEEMLNINIEKGGTSVLADGCLILGGLTAIQAEFIFGLGAYLQFTDDMQDIAEDYQSGNFSIYSNEAENSYIDLLAKRTFSFGKFVLNKGGCFGGEMEGMFNTLLCSGMNMFLAVLIGMYEKYYSPDYVKYIENLSPFGFSYVKKNYEQYSTMGMALIEKWGGENVAANFTQYLKEEKILAKEEQYLFS